MKPSHIIVLVLCGGVGSRLWPLSRKLLPKQFAPIIQGQTLFERTIVRNREISSRIMIAANHHQAFLAFNQLEEMGIHQRFGLIEPVGRNTAPAIALASMLAEPDAIILALPSDHIIANDQAYRELVQRGIQLAETDRIVTFGIKPEYPETGYGYIEVAAASEQQADPYRVISFREKPDAQTARSYLAAGNYYWNSGMFCFRAGLFLAELKFHAPQLYEASLGVFNQLGGVDLRASQGLLQPELEQMKTIPSLSVDYAVMEHSRRIAVLPCDMGWSDLGSLDALHAYYQQSASSHQNIVATGIPPIFIDAQQNMIIAEDQQIAVIGLDKLIVAATPDAVLIAKQGSSQKVRQVVQELEKGGEAQSRLLEHLPTVERPWGRYTILHEGGSYRVCKLEIKSGARSSLHCHHQREKHWSIVAGEAIIVTGTNQRHCYPGDRMMAPAGTQHCIENPAAGPLIIIETQLTFDRKKVSADINIDETD